MPVSEEKGMTDIRVTIVMPAYNSERTLERALSSIRSQTIDQNAIEILVIDGGSTDRTIQIAKSYGAVVLENPQKVPEAAKRIGFSYAHGEYIIMQDSDEVWCSEDQLMNRMNFFAENRDVYCLITDKLIPGKGCGLSCAYLNIVSDPFCYIIYQNKYSCVKQNREYLYKKAESGYVYQYSEDDITPIGDGGCTMINIQKARELYGERVQTQEFAASIFMQMVNATHKVGIIPDDNIIHYSTAAFGAYLRKLRFKIHTNLSDIEKSGYSSKARYSKNLRNRKRIFLLYSLSVVGPVLDSVRLAVIYKRPSLLLHFVYTYYVCAVACIEIVMKKMGISGKYSYGK